MDIERIIQVLTICIPVFGTIGLGKFLAHKKIINEDRSAFINTLVYNLCLPFLIFVGVATQDFFNLFNGALLSASFASILAVFVFQLLCSRLLRLQGRFVAVFIFGSFWANVTYMGFPLSRSAFQEEGFRLAVLYNAFVMPVFVIIGFFLIGYYASGSVSLGARIKKAVVNPVVISALLGICVVFFRHWIWEPLNNNSTFWVLESVEVISRIVLATLRMIGTMGLPLALIAIGASVRLTAVREHKLALVFVLFSKLILEPSVAFVVLYFGFPHATRATVGISVLLSAMPAAVASFIVAKQEGLEEEFVASLLVLSTALSIFTIPLWLYFLI